MNPIVTLVRSRENNSTYKIPVFVLPIDMEKNHKITKVYVNSYAVDSNEYTLHDNDSKVIFKRNIALDAIVTAAVEKYMFY